MNKKEESKFTGQLNQSKNKGEFFCINYAMVCSMAKENASAEAIMAYIVLARGCNRRNDLLISTWGAEGITKKTGMSYRTAQKALGWLSSKEYIYNAQNMANIPGNLGKGSGKHHSARWVLPIGSGEHFIYLANAMIDGIGNGKNNPPFARIYGEAFSRTGPMSELRLDSIMVLLHLWEPLKIAFPHRRQVEPNQLPRQRRISRSHIKYPGCVLGTSTLTGGVTTLPPSTSRPSSRRTDMSA